MNTTLVIVQFAVVIVLVAAVMIPYIKIIQKAGYSGWWGLVGFVPLVNIVMLGVFALAAWPSLRARTQ